MPATVTKTSNMQALNLRLKALEKMEILVGIPQENNSRPGEEISNSELAFIMENGSPINGIPPRPFIKPAITRDKKIISDQAKRAGQAILAGDEARANAEAQKTGIMASNSVKRFVADYPANNLRANAESTVRQKGFDHPLVREGELRRAISWSVQPIESLPKDKWKKSQAKDGGKFGSETDTQVPELAKKVARASGQSAESVIEKAAEGIAEAGETLGGAAELLVL